MHRTQTVVLYLRQVVGNLELFDEFPSPNSNRAVDGTVLEAIFDRTEIPVIGVEVIAIVLTLQIHEPTYDFFVCTQNMQT